ncbi:hypothetical protein PFFVO_03631 [Plasmodium falciparum Vietnam Oak-Knoll (FVO)]|uniref:Uncharacterized protein n=1 Tax=Plasmodium falciparum Vietnam Oak-Knoll (FVO) TaxID=1036723 RepID=A0A024V5H8_PLAFA|nr:hypothetical protein PFFVO_03631 [Plasmodium falciparum Vietnam Oak-Knoll (FVO)]
MEYTFLFYKHKHLIHLKENFEHIESYITYSLDSSFHNVNLVNDKEKDTILNHRECEYNNLTYEQIIDILQYSSICVSVCEKCQNGEKVNIVGIVSLDYELCINNNTNKYNFERMCDCPNINLEDFYYSLSLHIKAYNILSNLTLNNTLIINLILNNNENYYDNLFYYLFHSIENLLFILLFYNNNNNNNNIINEDLFSNGLTIDLTNLTQYEKQNKIIPFDHVLILNKSTYVSKIFLRLTSTSDIYDLHELFKKFSQTNLEEKNHYIIYDIIDKKTDEDILITILNNKKKIIGFVSLKKYIDINILNEIILLFLFLDLYELIIVEETTLFDCVSFKMFLDELVHIKKNYFICKYKHIDWLRNISNDDKNAFSLNLFILNDKYYSYCKDILLKIEKYFDEVDYIITTNNERGNMPFILNYFNRVKKKKKANTLESLYILNKYTLFLQPTTDYMKLEDIEHVQRLLEKVKHKEKNKIKQYILFLQDYCKDEVRKDNQHDHLLLKFYELHNYYIYVSRCGNNIINITTGSIMNNMDFYYINKIYDFKNILIPNENEKMKHFRLFFFSSIIIFKYYDKKIIHNILMLTNACSCQISTDDDVYLDIYRHFIFLNKKDNDVSIFREDNIFLRESEKTKKNEKNRNDRKNTKQCDKKYLVLTKHMCLRKCINIDHNIVFWGTNDICLNILYKILRKNEYFFNNIILIIAYKNKYLNTKNNVEENKSVKNCSLESALMYNKLKNIMINERIKIIYDNVYNINRKNKQIELNNKNYIYYDYLFICFDKQDVTTYSFNLNSFEEGKKRNFNFIETYENMNYKNIKFDFLVKEKDYEKYEHVNTFYSQKKKNYLLKKKKKLPSKKII